VAVVTVGYLGSSMRSVAVASSASRFSSARVFERTPGCAVRQTPALLCALLPLGTVWAAWAVMMAR
jgi:hypothetical protein